MLALYALVGAERLHGALLQDRFPGGGIYLVCMRSPDGKDYWSTGAYREIVKPERIVCTDSFADEKGNVVPATHYGMSADFLLEMLVTITFEEKEGKTKMTLRHVGILSGADQDSLYLLITRATARTSGG